MYKAVLMIMCAVALLVVCTAQVNFSPSWGKRGGPQESCKTSMDSLMYLYKLVQVQLEHKHFSSYKIQIS